MRKFGDKYYLMPKLLLLNDLRSAMWLENAYFDCCDSTHNSWQT